MNYIDFINEKGHVKAKTRTQIKNTIYNALNNFELIKNVNGGYSICVGTDAATNEPVWAHVSIKVNQYGPNIDEYSKREVKKQEIIIPNLFE